MLLVAVLAVLLKSIPLGYTVGGEVGLKVKANPDKVVPGGTSTLEVELKNVNPDKNVAVIVEARAHDSDLYFVESYTQAYRASSIRIGPEGVRKTSFNVKCKPTTLEGKYRIDVSAKDEGKEKGAEAQVFITVEKGKS